MRTGRRSQWNRGFRAELQCERYNDRHPCLGPEDGADFLCRQPLPFKYRIVPRFPEMDAEKLERLIAASYA